MTTDRIKDKGGAAGKGDGSTNQVTRANTTDGQATALALSQAEIAKLKDANSDKLQKQNTALAHKDVEIAKLQKQNNLLALKVKPAESTCALTPKDLTAIASAVVKKQQSDVTSKETKLSASDVKKVVDGVKPLLEKLTPTTSSGQQAGDNTQQLDTAKFTTIQHAKDLKEILLAGNLTHTGMFKSFAQAVSGRFGQSARSCARSRSIILTSCSLYAAGDRKRKRPPSSDSDGSNSDDSSSDSSSSGSSDDDEAVASSAEEAEEEEEKENTKKQKEKKKKEKKKKSKKNKHTETKKETKKKKGKKGKKGKRRKKHS
jgi:hypothetical protein